MINSSLDLAFTLDCTASMHQHINQAKNNMGNIVSTLHQQVRQVRFSLVEFRDHPPQLQGFITRCSGFTNNIYQIQSQLNKCAEVRDGVPIDLCFVLDSSGSVGPEDFQEELNFVKGTIARLHISPSHTRVGIIAYCSQVRKEMTLNKCRDVNSMIYCINNIRFSGDLTDTSEALNSIPEIFEERRSDQTIDNNLVKKIGILITDGHSNSYNATVASAKYVKSKGIIMYAIGVGNQVNGNELEAIASCSKNVFRVSGFNKLGREIQQAIIKDSQAGGNEAGADEPEAVEDALYETLKLPWTSAIKMCVLVVDQPPHGLPLPPGVKDNYPEGCPNNHDPIKLAIQLAEKGVSVYVVGCEPHVNPYKDFYMTIAYITGGTYIPLSSADNLPEAIVGAAKEELSLQTLMETVLKDVKAAFASGHELNEVELSKSLWQKLKDTKTTQLVLKDKTIQPISGKAKRFARLPSLNAVKKYYHKGQMADVGTTTNIEFETRESVLEKTQLQRMIQKAILMQKPN